MSGAVVAAAGAAGAVAMMVAALDQAAGSGRLDTVPDRDGGLGRLALVRGPGRVAGATRQPAVAHGIAAAVAASVGLIVAGAQVAALLGAVAVGGSVLRRRHGLLRQRRLRERAMPALARALADAMRGGSSVRGALAAVADDRAVPETLRRELGGLAKAVYLGMPLGTALEQLAERGDAGLRLLSGTVAMHLETGGTLASELDRLAADGEAALRIDEERFAATAQARATVRVVAALPVLALLGAEAASGSFVSTIARNPVALALLVVGFLLEGAAIVAARAIVGGRR